MLQEKVEQAEGTYTIVYVRESGMLVVCEPDGADVDAVIGDTEAKAGIELDRDGLVTESGLILLDHPEDGDDVRYRGGGVGDLSDRAGNIFDCAVRRA